MVLTIVKGSTYAPMNEKVSFAVNVVPEFSTLAVMVMAFSITALALASVYPVIVCMHTIASIKHMGFALKTDANRSA